MDRQLPARYREPESPDRLGVPRPVPLLALLLTLALGLSGCVSPKMYRPVNVEQEKDYTLAIIELDEQGELWAPSQVSRAVSAIERANQAESGSTVVVFVHGWNNNASQKQEEKEGWNLYEFKQYLSLIKRSREAATPGKSPPIVGVFVAWRGQASPGFLNLFSFYARRRAATRIASGPTVTETLTRVVHAAKQNPQSKAIVIGHSFGGLLTERAISQLAVGRAAMVAAGELRVPVDLVVFVNPASPSLQAKQVVEVFARERIKVYRVDKQGKRIERPLFVSVTSSADWATRYAYPWGSAVGATVNRFRTYGPEFCSPTASQRGYILYTPGHRTALHSHIMTAESLPAGAQPSPTVRYVDDPASAQPAVSFDAGKHRFTLKRKPHAANTTPYWIVRVPGSLIADHSDIFTDKTLRLFRTLLEITGALLPDSTTVITRETGLHPINLGVRPSGELLFTDRSRRVFAVPSGTVTPVFLACVPPGFDPAENIGGFWDQDSPVVFFNREVEHGKKVEYRTAMAPVRAAELQAGKVKPTRFEGEQRFYAATGDAGAQRAYLATKNEIYVADLTKSSPKPERLLPIDTPGQLSTLQLDAAKKRLFALDRKAGRLYLVNLQTAPPQAQLGVDGLGSPADLQLHAATGRVYVADAAGRQIWEVACEGTRCTKRVFARPQVFRAPSRLAVAADGTVWVADEEAGGLFATGPDGAVRRTISSLAGPE